ncbi:MAG: GHKL domain-containing protein [Lachnospiraceae bacterium]|nr:GHKL domain-containing protein [Lachnospiraceae bacterium]
MNDLRMLSSIFLGFPAEIFLAMLIFGQPLEKRRGSVLRFLAGAGGLVVLYGGVFYGLVLLVPSFTENRLMVSLIYSFLGYLYMLAFGRFWRNISPQEAVQLATNAYLTQHFAYCMYALVEPGADRLSGGRVFVYLLIYAAVYLWFGLAFARRLPEQRHYDTRTGMMVSSSFSVLVFSLVLSAFAQLFQGESVPLYRICQLYSMGVSLYILWVQLLQKRRLALAQELDMQQELFRKYKEQYEMTAENKEIINRKCHDLKHQVAALRHISDEQSRQEHIRELEKAVMIYDSVVETGNEVLDTILTEKSLICEGRNIQLTAVADGAALAFMDAVDIYTIFGNALDNAIESVSRLEDPEMRTISLVVARRGEMVMIQTENFYEGDRNWSGGTPATTKSEEPGYHGFGLKSIRYTAEKYQGFLTVEAENSVFLMRVVVQGQKGKNPTA